ncbi:MAG: response regulator [Candidatus Cloacimonetes bacterium]|nr:response regulator [Candidatus Cloacimonadota bacterium]MCF7869364.1 response regulator [Candidatus Cloacimonadota bacterium]
MKKKRIILVEDERIIAEDIKSTLSSHNYEVLDIFSKGEDALQNYHKLAPDLILMDIMLAGKLNGIQTAKKIHEEFNVPIIYLTAYANEDILSQAKITEPYGYLIKPFEERELYATIEMAFYRYKLESEIQKTQMRLSTVFNNVPNIILYEYGKKRQFISDNVNDLLGYTDQEVINNKQALLDLIHPEDKQIIYEKIENWNKNDRQGMLTIWYKVKHSDGYYVWVEDRLIEIKNSKEGNYITGVIVDNSNLKKAEEALKKSRSRYRAIVEDQTEFICRFDSNKLITFVNMAFCRLMNSDLVDLIGSGWNDYFPEQEIKKINKLLENLNVENPYSTIEFWFQDHKTEKLYLEWTFRAIFNDDNEFIEFQAVGKDTTQRKKAEIEKEKIREQLHQSQKMEVLGNLAGGIAHDFNNLLTAINGYADVAIKKLLPSDSALKDIEVIKDCGLKAAALTKQLLGFSRKQIIEKKLIDVNQIISNLNRILLRLIGNDISLQMNFSEEKSLINADANQVEQVLINLIVNAKDAMQNGGKIIVKTKKEYLDDITAKKLELEKAGNYEVISVQDNGSGIAPENLEKIFEPFFTTKELGKGTGLGLATVFGIVKQNNGHIEIETKLEKGTTFQIYLPSAEATETELNDSNKESDQETELTRGSETILLVEDEEAIRDFVASILKEYGYNVLEASNGEEGLRLAQNYENNIQLLLSDIRMPKMTGPELATGIKQIYPDIKIIFVSGHTENDKIRSDIEKSEAAFLQKPFSFEALVEKVRTELDKR